LKNPAGSGQADQTRSVADHLRLSDATGISLRIVILVAVVTLAIGVLLNRTQFGLRVRIAGRNPTMARWQGVDARRLAVQAFMLAGLLAGLAGAIELLGPGGQLTYGFSPDVGFIGIVIALVGGLRLGGIVIAALFFGGLHAAILYLPIVTDLPSSALGLLNGIVALLITISVVPAIWHRRRRVAAETGALNPDVPRVEVSAAP
jgi:simple sugar transport system permease protein